MFLITKDQHPEASVTIPRPLPLVRRSLKLDLRPLHLIPRSLQHVLRPATCPQTSATCPQTSASHSQVSRTYFRPKTWDETKINAGKLVWTGLPQFDSSQLKSPVAGFRTNGKLSLSTANQLVATSAGCQLVEMAEIWMHKRKHRLFRLFQEQPCLYDTSLKTSLLTSLLFLCSASIPLSPLNHTLTTHSPF